ncbi:hypothetical protein H3V11_09140 [Snodgrassella sp. W8158]|uniref:hypothetical protein n=1 Tax=Snodgrassella sp. W8158 TaxID=2751018 RepID=UPI0018DB95CC|nr:hypothetical protein [Snodgrassella sp. W8158]MBI0182103.1 hypothetical protein [Snodgrassella sp. W8158]
MTYTKLDADYLLKNIDRGKDLNATELKILVTVFLHKATVLKIQVGYVCVATISKLSNKYFYLKYELEDDGWRQEYTFYGQPTEVHLETRTEEHERWVNSAGDVLL